MALIVNISRGNPERRSAVCCGKNVVIDLALTPPTRRRNLGITNNWGTHTQTMHFGPPEFDVDVVYCQIVGLYRALTAVSPEYISVNVTVDEDFVVLRREISVARFQSIFKENWTIEQIKEKLHSVHKDVDECRLWL